MVGMNCSCDTMCDCDEYVGVPDGQEGDMYWRDIESAPKDGTSIIGFDPECGSGEYFWFGSWYGNKNDQGWMPANLDEEYGGYSFLTHWMPLPPAP